MAKPKSAQRTESIVRTGATPKGFRADTKSHSHKVSIWVIGARTAGSKTTSKVAAMEKPGNHLKQYQIQTK